MIKREETQLFTFRDKEVNQVYNVLLNYCSEQAVQIVAPAPFLHCTFNENSVFYNGRVALANKQSRYVVKLFGTLFPFFLQSLCSQLRQQLKGREVEVTLRSDEQTKLFSHRKNLKVVRFGAAASHYKVMFN